METFLYIVFFLSCIVLIAAVLLQPGKTDAGALFTSGVSSAAMNPRGTASVLSKLTIVTATVFMLSALLLSLPALTGNRSVLDTQTEVEAPVAPINANSNFNPGNSNNSNTGAANPANTAVQNAETNSAAANTETNANTNSAAESNSNK